MRWAVQNAPGVDNAKDAQIRKYKQAYEKSYALSLFSPVFWLVLVNLEPRALHTQPKYVQPTPLLHFLQQQPLVPSFPLLSRLSPCLGRGTPPLCGPYTPRPFETTHARPTHTQQPSQRKRTFDNV